MKRLFSALICCALILLLAGCRNDENDYDISASDIPLTLTPIEDANMTDDNIELLSVEADDSVVSLSLISIIPRYEARFDGEWHFTRHYSYSWTSATWSDPTNMSPVITWMPNAPNITEAGLTGFHVFTAENEDRFFILKQNDGVTFLEEFVNILPERDAPRITIINPSPEIALVVAWMGNIPPTAFLQQFEAFSTIENSHASLDTHIIIGATAELRDFSFFKLGHVCDPWIDDTWHPFYISETLGEQALLSAAESVLIPWHPVGTLPTFGISFIDETGTRRYFTLNTNEGSGFPPLFITEFTNRGYCPDCN